MPIFPRHSFPSNTWIHRITKKKESNKCDLCKTLWIVEVRFTKEEDLLEEDLEEDLPSSGRSSYEGRIFLLQEGLLPS